MGALALRPADLREFEGQARVQDLRLGEVLGFASPVDIRKLIRRNRDRLERHGEVFATVAKTPGKTGGRPVSTYYLNERQAYRLCMFSDAPNAEAVQDQMVEVFVAWRHGNLVPLRPSPEETAIERLVERIDNHLRIVTGRSLAETEAHALAVTYHPGINQYRRPDGGIRKQGRPRWWHDIELRRRAIQLHRQTTIRRAMLTLQEEFGMERAPKHSSLSRFWKNYDKSWGF